MAKKTIYICDFCDAILSDKTAGISKKHLSISFAPLSGWFQQGALEIGDWKCSNSIKGIKQFCSTACLKKYLDNLKNEEN